MTLHFEPTVSACFKFPGIKTLSAQNKAHMRGLLQATAFFPRYIVKAPDGDGSGRKVYGVRFDGGRVLIGALTQI